MKLKRKSMAEKDKWIGYELRENKWTIWEKVNEKIKFVLERGRGREIYSKHLLC